MTESRFSTRHLPTAMRPVSLVPLDKNLGGKMEGEEGGQVRVSPTSYLFSSLAPKPAFPLVLHHTLHH